MTAAQAPQVRAVSLAGDAAASRFSPSGSAWDGLAETEVQLQPTPLDRQPSAYVQTAWAGKVYGTLSTAGLTVAVAGSTLHLRLRWLAPDPKTGITDNDVFADAAAVLFPLNGVDAPLETMGDAQRPVQAWHWRAGTSQPFVVSASGLGTVTRLPRHSVEASADWANGQWTAVFSRPLVADGVKFPPGTSVPCGIAVWCGARGERAGLKSHTAGWITLALP